MIYLENVLKTSFQYVLKMFLQDILMTCLQDVLKTFWGRLEVLLKTYGQDKYIGLDQGYLKTSSEDEDKRRLQGHPVQMSWLPSNVAPRIKTKLTEFRGEIQKKIERTRTTWFFTGELSKNFQNIYLQSWTKRLRQTLVLMWNSALQDKGSFYFSAVVCWYWLNFHFGRTT